MNLIQNLVDRVQDYYATNKKPCKTYATESNAVKTAQKMADKIANYFGDEPKMVEYVVFFVPAMQRWTVAFNIKPLLNKHGGYVGIVSELGYFTY